MSEFENVTQATLLALRAGETAALATLVRVRGSTALHGRDQSTDTKRTN